MISKMAVYIKISELYKHKSNLVERFRKIMWNLLRAKVGNGEKDLETSLPEIEFAYNASTHASTGCSPARGF